MCGLMDSGLRAKGDTEARLLAPPSLHVELEAPVLALSEPVF